jgi:hypothetical protein
VNYPELFAQNDKKINVAFVEQNVRQAKSIYAICYNANCLAANSYEQIDLLVLLRKIRQRIVALHPTLVCHAIYSLSSSFFQILLFFLILSFFDSMIRLCGGISLRIALLSSRVLGRTSFLEFLFFMRLS